MTYITKNVENSLKDKLYGHSFDHNVIENNPINVNYGRGFNCCYSAYKNESMKQQD